MPMSKQFAIRVPEDLWTQAEEHAKRWSEATGITVTISDLLRLGLKHVLKGCAGSGSPLPSAQSKPATR